MTPTPLIVLLGPTAVGKSHLALALAERVGGEILAADSLQVYRGLDIGTAKPDADERRRIPHHLLDLVEPDQSFTAADYARLARITIAEVDEIEEPGGLDPECIHTPGIYVKRIVPRPKGAQP